MLAQCARATATVVVVALVRGIASVALAADPAADVMARGLVEKVSAQYRSVKSERETLETLVVAAPLKEAFSVDDAAVMVRDGGRGITHKRAVRYALYAEGGRDKSYVRFSLPPEDAGTEFLVWREPRPDGDSQWLFMPALAKVRRVPVSSTATFMGTDLTYEDIREQAGENVDRYTYAYVGTEVWDGHDCHVVTARPVATTVSAYGSRKMWIDKDRPFIWKVEYADGQGTVAKVLRNSGINEVRPGVYRPALTQMRDLRINELTLIWFSDRAVGIEPPDEVFSVDFLGNR